MLKAERKTLNAERGMRKLNLGIFELLGKNEFRKAALSVMH
jgi:hypothetical protein